MSAEIEFRAFPTLSGAELHDLLKLRFDVFVMEQQSLYPEIDGKDPVSLHALAREGEEIVGTLRLTGLEGSGEVNLGRIALRADRRRDGLGGRMIRAALARAAEAAPGRRLGIEAQAHLQPYYERFGFERVSDEYMDGGIPHVDMALTLPAT